MMKLSTIGKKLTTRSGILELMDDLGAAMANGDDMRMLGGGNRGAWAGLTGLAGCACGLAAYRC